MLSSDNADETATNKWRLCEQAGLPRLAGLHGNAVSGHVGEDGKDTNVSQGEVLECGLWLDRPPDLRLVVTMKKPAEIAFKTYLPA